MKTCRTCLHCQRTADPWRRGLCRRCWDQPAVREKYQRKRKVNPKRPCLHCRTRQGRFARGLCRVCWGDRAVRDRYRPLKDCGRSHANGVRCHADFNGSGGEPEPTRHLPGTPEHDAVLTGRAARGERLRHPKDARREAS